MELRAVRFVHMEVDMADESPAMLRPGEVARVLGLSRVRIYALIRKGAIPAARVGGAVRIPRDAWNRWLAAKADEALGNTRAVP